MEAVASYPAARTKTSLPGNFAIWIFICAELLVFGIFSGLHVYQCVARRAAQRLPADP